MKEIIYKRIKISYFISFLILSSLLFSKIESGKYLCVGVSNGDSIWIMVNGQRVRVKIDGVDCPELGQDFGMKAKQFTSALATGKVVEVSIKGVDKSNTPSAYIFTPKGDVGLELLKAGLAWNLRGSKDDDPVYSIVESEAKAKKVGLWSMANPVAPWEFRKDALAMINDDYKKTQKVETVQAQLATDKAEKSIDETTEAPKSIYEEQRAKGLERFENEVIELAKKADQMDIEYTRYKDACLNKYTSGNFDGNTSGYIWGRKWFVYWDGGFSGGVSINNESTPECLKIWSDFSRLTREIKTGIEFSMEMARKAGVYPGQMRKVREKYYLDWSGWD